MALPAVSLAAWTTALHPLAMTGPITKSERDHVDFAVSDSVSEDQDMLALLKWIFCSPKLKTFPEAENA